MKHYYDKTLKIEVLNEFSNGVYARLLNFVLKNGIDQQDKNNFYNTLLDQFAEMIDLNLFKMSFEELKFTCYWKNMHHYVLELYLKKV